MIFDFNKTFPDVIWPDFVFIIPPASAASVEETSAIVGGAVSVSVSFAGTLDAAE